MRVALTKPWIPPSQRTIVTLPIGSLYLASYLKRSLPHFDVTIFDPDVSTMNEGDFYGTLASFSPDILGITVFSHVVPVANRMIQEIRRKSPSTVVVIGGPHINAVRQRALIDLPGSNFAVWGEGETAFSLLCSRLEKQMNSDLHDIPGVICHTQDGVALSADNTYNEDLETYEPVDYNLIRLHDYFRGSPMGLFHRGHKVAQIITTRGCPFACTFCASPLNMGRKVRVRPMNRVLDELRTLHDQGADELHLMDDNFTFNKQHVLSFCHGVKNRGIHLHFALPNGVRLDRLDDEMLAAMRGAGFYHLGFGIEVGSDASLRRIRKSLTLDTIREKIAMAKKHGFGTTGFFIVGFPFETEADMIKTAFTPDSLGLDLASFGNFTPLPGTEIYADLVASGEIPSDYLPSFASGKATYAPRSIGIKKMEKIHRYVVLHYYLNPKRLRLMIHLLRWSDLRYVFRRLLHIVFRPNPAA